jgi:hypothetical protein
MIRNLLITDREGNILHCSSFGDCYSVCENSSEIADFVNALTSYGKILVDGRLNQIQVADMRFLIRTRSNLIFTISTDDDDLLVNDATLKTIIDHFTKLYATFSVLGKDDSTAFQDFPHYLMNRDILQLDC